MSADCIIHNAKIATNSVPAFVEAIAIQDGKVLAAGTTDEVLRLHHGPSTKLIDANQRTVIPGLNDSHLHLIRGGLNYNMELRWDGVPSLADALRMLKEQAQRTPPPQWVRVVGGWTEFQFAERRMPTLEEINAAAPDTPVFVLHLYDRALLNEAALRAVRLHQGHARPAGRRNPARQERQSDRPADRPAQRRRILYATLAKGPKLPPDDQLNSTRHFMRELNRLGVTSVIDAGGGFQNYPDDYAVIEELHRRGEMTVRIAYNLFTQKPKRRTRRLRELDKMTRPGEGDDFYRMNGAGEMLVFSAADFEDFLEPRPDLPPVDGKRTEGVVRHLAENRWPFRLHATYDETISRSLDVFEEVNRDVPFDGCTGSSTTARPSPTATWSASRRWAAASPCSTAWPIRANISSIATARKRPSVPRRFAGCWRWASRSAPAPTPRASPATIRVSLYWLVTGKTVGGTAPVSGKQPPRPRGSAAPVHRGQRLVFLRGRQKGTLACRPVRRSGCAVGGLLLYSRGRDQATGIRADARRRQGRVRRR